MRRLDFYHLLAKAVNKCFGKKLYAAVRADFTYAKDNLITKNSAPFLRDQLFLKAYSEGKKTDKDRFLKGVDIEWRIHTLCWAADYAKQLDGDFVECGTRTGFFAKSIIEYLGAKAFAKRFVLIDSFQGVIPEFLSDNEKLRESKGVKSDDIWSKIYNQVKEQFSSYDRVEVYKGVIPEVLENIEFGQISFLSLDLNNAYAEKKALDYIWPYLQLGGIIVLDDYGYPGFEEQQKMHDEFARSHNTSVLCLPTCQGIIIKTE